MFSLSLSRTHARVHTHTHRHTTKYLHCYKIYKCNNYEYKKHNLISKRGYRLTAQRCTNFNTNARAPPPQKKVQYKLQNSRNVLTNRRINNNALVVQVIQKSWAHYMQLSWLVKCTKTVCSNRCFFTKWAWQFIHYVSTESCVQGSHFRPQNNQYAIHKLS